MAISLDINLSDTEAADSLADALNAFIPTVRDRRKQQLEQWMLNHSAWRSKNTRAFFHSDTFNHYVPAFRRAVEKFVIRAAQMLMPTNEFFEVYPADELNDDDGKRAASIMAFMLYLLRKKIKAYPLVKQLLRCHVLYGRAIVKPYVRVENNEVWPGCRAVDPFAFLVYPETVSDMDDASIINEDSIIPYQQYESMAKKGGASPIDPKDLRDVEWPFYTVRRLHNSGITTPPTVSSESTPTEQVANKLVNDYVAMSEVWVHESSGWRFCWIVWNLQDKPKVVKISKRFPRPQYRMTVARDIPGEQYTSSMGDDMEPIQILVNDQTNMFFEALAMAGAGPVAVDPNQVSRSASLVYKPRAKWLVPPAAVQKVDLPDTSASALKGVHFAMGLMDSFGGSSPLSEGQPIRNLPRSGGAVSALLNMSLADIRDVAKAIEDDLLAPMLSDMFALTVQYVPESQIFKIPGTQWISARNMTIKDLQGDWDFHWVGSIQSKDMEEQAARYMKLLETLTQLAPIIIPDLAQRGKRINWTGILKNVWRKGLGERGADTLIEDIAPGEQLPPMPQAPGQGGP